MNLSPEIYSPLTSLPENQQSPPYDANLAALRDRQITEEKDAENEEDISKADLSSDEAEATADGAAEVPIKE